MRYAWLTDYAPIRPWLRIELLNFSAFNFEELWQWVCVHATDYHFL